MFAKLSREPAVHSMNKLSIHRIFKQKLKNHLIQPSHVTDGDPGPKNNINSYHLLSASWATCSGSHSRSVTDPELGMMPTFSTVHLSKLLVDLKIKERTGYQELLTDQDVQKRNNRYKGNKR